MAAIITPIAIGLSAISGVASLAQGIRGRSDAQFIGERNAQLLEQESAQARGKAGIEAEEQQKRDQRLMAAQRARFGASGLDFTTGSPLRVLTTTAREAELDRQRILAGGDVEAARFRTQAQTERLRGFTAGQSAFSSGVGGFLSGLGSAGSLYVRRYDT